MRVENEFMEAMSDLEQSIEDVNADFTILAGDFNVDISRNNAHCNHLLDMCSRQGLKLGWYHDEAHQAPTFVSPDERAKSCIDHFILSPNMFSCIKAVCVIDHVLNPPGSWHRPIVLNVAMPTKMDMKIQCFMNQKESISWNKVQQVHYDNYKIRLGQMLEHITMPIEALECGDLMCEKIEHAESLNQYCIDIIDCCVRAGEECFPKVSKKKKNKPYWSEIVNPKREAVLLWGQIWQDCGKPREGIVSEIYRHTKRDYHYAVRYINRHENELRKQKMMECLMNNNQRDFWRESRKFHNCGKMTATCVDNADSNEEIADVFATKYRDLYNSVPSHTDEMDDIRNKLNSDIMQNGAEEQIVTSEEITRWRERFVVKPHKVWPSSIVCSLRSTFYCNVFTWCKSS